jgi:ADP-ribosylglycohydrolase
MFGAVYGDIIGSYYETHSTKDYDFPFADDSCFTDDSVLIAAICNTILNDPAEIGAFGARARSRQFASQYRQLYSAFPNAGFGAMFSEWARNPNAGNNRSYANGAAMRVMPIAYAYRDWNQMMRQVEASCLPTHNCNEAKTAAYAVAAAIRMALSGQSKQDIKEYIEDRYYDLSNPISQIKRTHVFDSRASYSVPASIQAFLESDDYESALRNAVSLGGDADTEACIAGGIAEAFYHDIPQHISRFCDERLRGTVIKSIVKRFEEKYG